MKNIQKTALYISAFILSTSIINCSSEDGDTSTVDIKKEEPKKAEPVANIVIQAESIELNGDWKLRNTIEGSKGDGYIIWEGQDRAWKGNIGNIGKLSYKVQIDTPGKYNFKWRSIIGKLADKDPWAEHNDSWLKFPDAKDSYTLNGTRKHYPNGSGKTPNGIAGENGNGFFKVFMNDTKNWQTIASTWDKKGFPIFVEFDKAGEYTIEIAARDSFHTIDELVLIYQK